MARTSDPNSVEVSAFFTKTERDEIRVEQAQLGNKPFTEYVLYLRAKAKALTALVNKLSAQLDKKKGSK